MKGGARTPAQQDLQPEPPTRGTLFVVATPIGNLEDMTLRALRVLREVALVAAEDTRRTANLLRHYQIPTPLVSVHEHNERRRTDEVIQNLASGRSVALVSDAGTPGIADPGAHLVAAARAAGFRVEAVPGASAVTAALSASGLSAVGHTFLGFPPASGSSRRDWFANLPLTQGHVLVIFEAPHRIRQTLDELDRVLGEQPILIVRELTKLHEQWLAGAPATISEALASPAKGEFVLLIPPIPDKDSARDFADPEIGRLFGQLTENAALTRRDGVRAVARQLGMSPKAVYAAIERTKNSRESR